MIGGNTQLCNVTANPPAGCVPVPFYIKSLIKELICVSLINVSGKGYSINDIIVYIYKHVETTHVHGIDNKQ